MSLWVWLWIVAAALAGILAGMVAMALMSAGAAAQARQEGWEARRAYEVRRWGRFDSDDDGEPD